MPKKLTDEEYYRTLPKKQVGTAVILLNAKGEILIVKPDYRDSWLVPGGSADEGESPLHCAIRETEEEIGLTIPVMELAGIYFAPGSGPYSDSLKFIFYGGILSESQISQIVLQKNELEEYKFLSPEEAGPAVSESLRLSLPSCLDAIRNGTVAYIEK